MKLWNWQAWQTYWWEDGPGKDVECPDAAILQAWERALEDRMEDEKKDARLGAALLERLGHPQPSRPPPRRWYDSQARCFRAPRFTELNNDGK